MSGMCIGRGVSRYTRQSRSRVDGQRVEGRMYTYLTNNTVIHWPYILVTML